MQINHIFILGTQRLLFQMVYLTTLERKKIIFVPFQKINRTCSISGILFAIIYFEVLEQLDYGTKTYFETDIKRQGSNL